MASSAYREQLGTKRQDLGKIGENNSLYILMKKMMNLQHGLSIQLLTPVRGIKCLDKIALEFIPIKVEKFPVWHKNQIMTWWKNPLVRAK